MSTLFLFFKIPKSLLRAKLEVAPTSLYYVLLPEAQSRIFHSLRMDRKCRETEGLGSAKAPGRTFEENPKKHREVSRQK